MRGQGRAGAEPLALIAAAVTIAVAMYYLWLIRQQVNQPVPWVLAVLLAAALLSAYGAIHQLPGRRVALLVAALALTTLGLLALPSIGWPIIVSGLLALASLFRRPLP